MCQTDHQYQPSFKLQHAAATLSIPPSLSICTLYILYIDSTCIHIIIKCILSFLSHLMAPRMISTSRDLSNCSSAGWWPQQSRSISPIHMSCMCCSKPSTNRVEVGDNEIQGHTPYCLHVEHWSSSGFKLQNPKPEEIRSNHRKKNTWNAWWNWEIKTVESNNIFLNTRPWCRVMQYKMHKINGNLPRFNDLIAQLVFKWYYLH